MKTRFIVGPEGSIKAEHVYESHDRVRATLHSEELSAVIDADSFRSVRAVVMAVKDQKAFHLVPMKFCELIFLIEALELFQIKDLVCTIE